MGDSGSRSIPSGASTLYSHSPIEIRLMCEGKWQIDRCRSENLTQEVCGMEDDNLNNLFDMKTMECDDGLGSILEMEMERLAAMKTTYSYKWRTKQRKHADGKTSCFSYPTIVHPLRTNIFAKFDQLEQPTPTFKVDRTSRASTSSSNSLTKSTDSKDYSKVKEAKFIDPLGKDKSMTFSCTCLALSSQDAYEDYSKVKEAKFIDPLGATVEKPVDDSIEDAFSRLEILQNRNSTQKHTSDYQKIRNTLVDGDHDTAKICSFNDFSFDDLCSWSSKKAEILKKFVTDKKLSIVTSFLPGGVPVHTQITNLDLKLRLEQLDSFCDNRKIKDLSQKEYVDKVSELTKALLKAWSEDQRVQAIRIAIQCAQFLANTNDVPDFYPSQFFIVIDVLDTFGRLVYTRLEQKVMEELKLENLNFNDKKRFSNSIPDGIQEIARNWFYKIASIRELLPRFYVETSLLPVYRFLEPSEVKRSATRLAEMCRGFGDPLVAFYARSYLLKSLLSVDRSFKEPTWRCFHDCVDFLSCHQRASSKLHSDWINLFLPALEWIAQCLVYGFTADDYSVIVSLCEQRKCSLLNHAVLIGSPTKLISNFAVEWLRTIKLCYVADVNSANVERLTSLSLQRLATALCNNEPSPELVKPLVREAWRMFRKFGKDDQNRHQDSQCKRTGIGNYIKCAVQWLRFSARHFGSSEIDSLLNELIHELRAVQDQEPYFHELMLLLDDLLAFSVPRFGYDIVYRMESFCHFIDIFELQDLKVSISKRLLTSFSKHYGPSECDDPQLSNHCLNCCQTLHSTLSVAFSSTDEQKQTSLIICRSLDRIDFGSDYDRQLSFLVEARGLFCRDANYGADLASAHVVRLVLRLLARLAHEQPLREFSSSRQHYGDLSRSCVAFVFITIPSINDNLLKTQLYLNTIPLAQTHGCLPQADSLLRALINILAQEKQVLFQSSSWSSPLNNETHFIEVIKNLLSLLLYMPHPPDKEPLFYFDALLNLVMNFDWTPESGYEKIMLMMNFIIFLANACQVDFEYEIPGSHSNSKLHGGSKEYIDACDERATEITRLILRSMEEFSSSTRNPQSNINHQPAIYDLKSTLALNFFELIVVYGDLSDSDNQFDNSNCYNLFNLARNLWILSGKTKNRLLEKRRRTLHSQFLSRSTSSDSLLRLLNICAEY